MLTYLLLTSLSLAQDFTVMVPMRDGVELATDVYLPTSGGPWPVLLQRTPYGRGKGVGDPYTPYGLAIVSQDTRGRFDSQGTDTVFRTEGADGPDTIEWIRQQDWSNGTVATTGGSALGIIEYLQTATGPPGLVLVTAAMATPNFYSDGLFWGGVFRQSLIEGWLEDQGSTDFLDEIAAHPYEDDFWDPVQTTGQASQVQAVGVHIGGWYDIFSQGTLDAFSSWQSQGGEGALGSQFLVMGPWTHAGSETTKQGELVYPESSLEIPYDPWWGSNVLLDEILGLGLGWGTSDDWPTVQYYVMGDVDDDSAPGNTWRSTDTWPPEAAPVRVYLQPDGGLSTSCPPDDGGTTSYRFDPDDPSPTVCGSNLLIDAGPCDQRAVEVRDDNVVFDSGPLDVAMEITGRVQAHLWVDIDRPDADLMLRLTDVYPDGRSMLILDGAARLAARGRRDGLELLSSGEILEAVVDLWSTSIILAPGHSLRATITSSNSPRFMVNPNSGSGWGRQRTESGTPVNVRLHHSTDLASYLELPDPTSSADDVVICGSGSDAGSNGASDSPATPTSQDATRCGCSSAPGGPVLLSLVALGAGLRRRKARKPSPTSPGRRC